MGGVLGAISVLVSTGRGIDNAISIDTTNGLPDQKLSTQALRPLMPGPYWVRSSLSIRLRCGTSNCPHRQACNQESKQQQAGSFERVVWKRLAFSSLMP